MEFGFDPGALLGRLYELPRGPRVRLRLPRPTDARGIRELFRQRGAEASELELARLVRFDPRHSVVICATALLDGRERVVGIGSIPLGGEVEEPDLLKVDSELTGGLDGLLRRALLGRAHALARSHAA